MSEEAIAQARRLHHHVMNGGNVTALDLSRLVQAMERMQAEQLKCAACNLLTGLEYRGG
jgi:hypothetical protein